MPRVLITGASRGIGHAAALRLAGGGWDVIAGVRTAADAEALRGVAGGTRLTPVVLDVASADDVGRLDEVVADGLDAVVNNAGYALDGPVEGLDLDALRRQFEVNVFGQVAVTQQVLPALRRSRGRIVFTSSISGRISTPMTGAYNASKFALEGIADALRVELRPWRIKVVLIEPGPVATDLWGKAPEQHAATLAALDPETRELYAGHLANVPRVIKTMQRLAVSPDKVVDRIERALTASKPRARYYVNPGSRAQLAGYAATPTAVFDAVIGRVTGVPRRA
jgi:NAD(P)-dependent dehydrogenase (short-subunit alcohol dehydrogenase family)